MSLVMKAYEFAKNAHKGQKDFAGNDYITHPIFVQAHLDSDILKNLTTKDIREMR